MPEKKDTISDSELSGKLKTFVQDVIDRAVQQYIKETEMSRQLPSDQEDGDSTCLGNPNGRKNTTITDNDITGTEPNKEDNRISPDTNDASDKVSPHHEDKPLLKETSSLEEMVEETRISDRCLRILEYVACCHCSCFKRTYDIASEDD